MFSRSNQERNYVVRRHRRDAHAYIFLLERGGLYHAQERLRASLSGSRFTVYWTLYILHLSRTFSPQKLGLFFWGAVDQWHKPCATLVPTSIMHVAFLNLLFPGRCSSLEKSYMFSRIFSPSERPEGGPPSRPFPGDFTLGLPGPPTWSVTRLFFGKTNRHWKTE